MESTYQHFQRDDVVAEYASFDFLLAPEQAIMRELEPTLGRARMLDVGVGAGRTALHFAPRVRQYVGVDVSRPMIEACRGRLADQDLGLLVADARHLPFAGSSGFDVVLFSFNSLDVVGDQRPREEALSEIHRVCRPNGIFFFSSHNLAFAEARFSVLGILRELARSPALRTRPAELLKTPRRLVKVLRQPFRWRRLNAPTRRLASRRGAMVVEERPRYELLSEFYARPQETMQVELYYIRPDDQIDQLEALGFGNVRVFAPDGQDVTGEAHLGLPDHQWLYYLCHREAT